MAIDAYRELGVWRRESAVDDVDRWVATMPDEPALLADRAATGLAVVTWGELGEAVERFSAALAALGIGRGGVVAMQLPNWWEAVALALACWRRGAVLAPIMTTIRGRELERMLARVEAEVMITTGVWNGHDHAATLAEIAPRLPALRHRVILRGAAGGGIDFEEFFLRTDHPSPGEPVSDPDMVSQILFTSGTTGEPKAALRTLNNHYAQMRPGMTDAAGWPVRRVYTPQSVMHSAGLGFVVHVAAVGGCLLLTDTWEPGRAARLLAEHRIEHTTLVPPFLASLLTALRANEIRLPLLREVYSVGSTIPAELAEETMAVLGFPLRSVWAMTEGGRANTEDTDPRNWAARSIGRPPAGTQLVLRPQQPDTPIDERRPGTLLMRGASVCLATQDRDGGTLRLIADHDDGWYDTGDLAIPDGRGGFRLMGRVADRVGGAFMIPVADVEAVLCEHPRVVDVAVVGHRGGTEGCAVVVTNAPLDLAEVHRYLHDAGMTEWYWPTRLERIDELPRNAMGKVEKARLREWLSC